MLTVTLTPDFPAGSSCELGPIHEPPSEAPWPPLTVCSPDWADTLSPDWRLAHPMIEARADDGRVLMRRVAHRDDMAVYLIHPAELTLDAGSIPIYILEEQYD